MNDFQMCFSIAIYAFMGVGTFASTIKVEKETPMHFIALLLLWPVLLLMFSIMFLFTGRRINE